VVCGKVPPSQISPAFQARRGVVPEDGGGGGWRLTADDPYARFPHVMSGGGASWAGDGGSGAPPRGEGGSWPGAVHGASGAAGPGQRPHPPPRTRRRLRGGGVPPQEGVGELSPREFVPSERLTSRLTARRSPSSSLRVSNLAGHSRAAPPVWCIPSEPHHLFGHPPSQKDCLWTPATVW